MSAPYLELMVGLPIIQVPLMEDTWAAISHASDLGPCALVGTKPPDEMELVRREARLLVRRGLADVLEWLGRPVVNEPVLDAIRAQALR